MINPLNHPSSHVVSHEARDLTIATCKTKIFRKYMKFHLYSCLIYTRKELLPNEFGIFMDTYPKSF
jgi:hypothetical protein